jgi:hypothetical protein
VAENFPVPEYDQGGDIKEQLNRLVDIVRLLMDGKHNATGTVTFTANATSTTITDARIGGGTVVLLFPSTESAAGEVAYWQSSTGEGTATITHQSDERSDRTFFYVLQG